MSDGELIENVGVHLCEVRYNKFRLGNRINNLLHDHPRISDVIRTLHGIAQLLYNRFDDVIPHDIGSPSRICVVGTNW